MSATETLTEDRMATVAARSNVYSIPFPASAASAQHLRPVSRTVPACSTCASLVFCLPFANENGSAALEELVSQRIRLRKGESLVHSGDAFTHLFAVRSGSCKSVVTTCGGQEQIAGYHIAGEILGAQAIYSRTHDCTIVALEDSEFCVLPFDRMESLARQSPEFQHSFNALLSREIVRERRVMLMLGTMRAEQRLASFLLDLAERYRARGYSSCEFVLRMTREEIGSHLGLKLETVSRLFSRFHQEGLIRVQGRDVKLLDRVALTQLVEATLQ
jgi:CRP/FNR family transcriptional regulator, anaerobic regulatory protein